MPQQEEAGIRIHLTVEERDKQELEELGYFYTVLSSHRAKEDKARGAIVKFENGLLGIPVRRKQNSLEDEFLVIDPENTSYVFELTDEKQKREWVTNLNMEAIQVVLCDNDRFVLLLPKPIPTIALDTIKELGLTLHTDIPDSK